MAITSLSDLLSIYRSDAFVARITEDLNDRAARVRISGTIGSAQLPVIFDP